MNKQGARGPSYDPVFDRHMFFHPEPSGPSGGGSGTATPPAQTFDPAAVPADWLQAQLNNHIAKLTEGKGIDGLVNSRNIVLAEKKKLQDDFAALQEKIKPFGDIDQAAQLFKKFGDDEELKLFKEGKVDDLVKRRTDAAQKRWQEELSKRDQTLAEKDKEFNALMDDLSKATVDRALAEAAHKAGVHKAALTDLINRGRAVFRLEREGGKLNVVAKDAQGVVIFGKDGKSPQSPEEWVENLKSDAPHFFPGSSGGGSQGGAGTGGSDVIRLRPGYTQADWEAAQAEARTRGLPPTAVKRPGD